MPVTIGGGLTFCGRELKPEELDVIRQITREFSTLSLTELAHTVCELLEWRRLGRGVGAWGSPAVAGAYRLASAGRAATVITAGMRRLTPRPCTPLRFTPHRLFTPPRLTQDRFIRPLLTRRGRSMSPLALRPMPPRPTPP